MKLLNRSEFTRLITFSFLLKAFVIFSLLNIIIFEIRYILREYDPLPRNKIYLKGIITNPEALYLSSIELENQGKIKDATIDMRLATSLLEAGNYSTATKSRYMTRLKNLEKMTAVNKSKN